MKHNYHLKIYNIYIYIYIIIIQQTNRFQSSLPTSISQRTGCVFFFFEPLHLQNPANFGRWHLRRAHGLVGTCLGIHVRLRVVVSDSYLLCLPKKTPNIGYFADGLQPQTSNAILQVTINLYSLMLRTWICLTCWWFFTDCTMGFITITSPFGIKYLVHFFLLRRTCKSNMIGVQERCLWFKDGLAEESGLQGRGIQYSICILHQHPPTGGV